MVRVHREYGVKLEVVKASHTLCGAVEGDA